MQQLPINALRAYERTLFRYPVESVPTESVPTESVLGVRKRRVTIAACLTQSFRACYTEFSIGQEGKPTRDWNAYKISDAEKENTMDFGKRIKDCR